MSIIEALEWRYAVKKFDNEKLLADSKVNTLKKAFNLTATSYGLQPVTLLIVSDKRIQKKLTASSWNQKQVENASHVLILCIQDEINETYIKRYFERVKHVRNTPDEVLEPFQDFLIKDFKKKTVEEIKNWAKNQAYLALGNLLTVCAIEGIDACPMEGFSPDEYDEILQLKEKNLSSVLVLPVGYRAEDDMFANFKKVRKPLKDSVIDF
ncbi:NAD(P)H-dependent oxidoreductase [Galbibacter mesophilus]|uniref:NAD(P)H-dependent oxidoreductase n=1 Tax=Galbibacter mesophilus TaxID=379069 RepID=UPI0019203090|nr:NAD(P)H-dependent oxidoreductase [Galbibacter mesophilus]MCM5663618.1 NAD(P)H-dependent oxidoreductase [Galbibacter mesophilus]